MAALTAFGYESPSLRAARMSAASAASNPFPKGFLRGPYPFFKKAFFKDFLSFYMISPIFPYHVPFKKPLEKDMNPIIKIRKAFQKSL